MRHISFNGRIFAFIVALGFVLEGCVTLSTRSLERSKMFERAAQQEFRKIYLSTPPFVLTAYHKFLAPSNTLVVYIEGDGYAWASRTMPSDDPTPKRPLAFFLASEDPSTNVLYIARPGQFLKPGEKQIDQVYWTSRRYSEEVISAVNTAIDQVKRSSGAKQVSLIGYSGGATVAVLVVARRDDVVALRTVAGNLATDVFSRVHHISPLSGSIDPVSVASKIQGIPQRHFIGRRDRVIVSEIPKVFLAAEGDTDYKGLTEIEEADHLNGWVERWVELLAVPLHH